MEKPARPQFQEGERWRAPLEEIVPGSELLKQHPELRKLEVGFIYDLRSRADYFPKTNRILIRGKNQQEFCSKLQHEVDHALKEATGGPPGASVEYRGVEGTPDHQRAIAKYRRTPGEILARQAAERPFGEYFGMKE